MSLSGMFRAAASPLAGAALGQNGPNRDIDLRAFGLGGNAGPSTTANRTMLSTLSTTNFTADVTTVPTKMDVTPDVSAVDVEPARDHALSARDSCEMAQSTITATLREAQNDVRAAMKGAGVRGNPFGGSASAGSAGGLVINAAADVGLSGMDTLVADLAAGLKGEDKDTAIAAIRDELVHRQTAPNSDGVWDASMPSAQAAAPAPAPTFDWAAFFDEGHDLEEFMAIDPEKPPASLVPEYAELDAHLHETKEHIAYYEHALEYVALPNEEEFTWDLEDLEDMPLSEILAVALPPEVSPVPEEIKQVLERSTDKAERKLPPPRPELTREAQSAPVMPGAIA